MNLQRQLNEIIWELGVVESPCFELSEAIKTLTREMGRDKLLAELKRIRLGDNNNYAYGANKLIRILFESHMKFLLIQGTVISQSESIDKLNFSNLSHTCDWSVYIKFADRTSRIAHVNWVAAAEYRTYCIYAGYTSSENEVTQHSHIVPAVRDGLKQLFGLKYISEFVAVQPCVYVIPIN